MSKFVLRNFITVSVVAVITALAVPAFAEDAAKPQKPSQRQYTGDIVSVDAAAQAVVVTKKKDDQKTFAVTDKTRIHIGEKEVATLAELKAGDRVKVEFTEDGNKNIATKISPAKKKLKDPNADK